MHLRDHWDQFWLHDHCLEPQPLEPPSWLPRLGSSCASHKPRLTAGVASQSSLFASFRLRFPQLELWLLQDARHQIQRLVFGRLFLRHLCLLYQMSYHQSCCHYLIRQFYTRLKQIISAIRKIFQINFLNLGKETVSKMGESDFLGSRRTASLRNTKWRGSAIQLTHYISIEMYGSILHEAKLLAGIDTSRPLQHVEVCPYVSQSALRAVARNTKVCAWMITYLSHSMNFSMFSLNFFSAFLS